MRSNRRIAQACSAVAVGLVALCGPEGPAAAEASPAAVLTVAAAQEMVHDLIPEVERLRGLAFKRPVPVEIVGEEGARRYMMARLEAFDQEEQLEWLGKAY